MQKSIFISMVFVVLITLNVLALYKINRLQKDNNSLSEKIGEDNVIFLATYTNDRDLYVFKRANEIKGHIYNIGSYHYYCYYCY